MSLTLDPRKKLSDILKKRRAMRRAQDELKHAQREYFQALSKK